MLGLTLVVLLWFNSINIADSDTYTWKRVQSMEGKLVTGASTIYYNAIHRTFCAQICSMHINCQSFFYDVADLTCYLHDDVYTISSPSQPSSTKYYVSANKELTAESHTSTTTTTTTEPTTTTTVTTTEPTTTATTEPITTTTVTTTVPPPTCPGTFINTGGYCFKISGSKDIWGVARTSCQSTTDADLLIIDSSVKQQFFSTYMKNNGYMGTYHFGVYHIYANKNFQLVDGRTQATSTFTYWGFGEPNNLNGPNLCGFLNWKASNTELRWNDRSCKSHDLYICEVIL